jgi:hypothetical protein
MVKAQLVQALEARARQGRNDYFVELLRTVPMPLSILDVGGTVDYWRTVDFPIDTQVRIVLLNTFNQRVDPPFESVVGDARDLSCFRDREYNVVFSNSVICLVGSFVDQQRMAREIQRVGQYFFLQTPNHSFPVDWRTLIPFFHFLPIDAQAWCFERFAVGTYRRARTRAEALTWASRVRNLRWRDLQVLFPNAEVMPERFGGFTKSFMIHNLPTCRSGVV